MKFMIPLRHGLRAAWQNPKLVLLTWLASLLPALFLGLGTLLLLRDRLDDSLFAAAALSGRRYGVWSDLGRGNPGDLDGIRVLFPWAVLVAVVIHVLLAAGVVESLLARERARERPFLLGIGRHGWRFLRAGVSFAFAAAALAIVVGAAIKGVSDLATEQADGALQYFGALGVGALGVLLFVPLDLGYDLGRIAAATHGEGRTLRGFLKAWGHALLHPLMLAPMWLFFSLLVAGLHLSYIAARASWGPSSLGEVVALLAVQQVVFLLAAFLRVGLWGGEVAYYQAVGEPRWCGRKERPRELTAPARPARSGEAPAPDLTSHQPTEPITPPARTGPTAAASAATSASATEQPTEVWPRPTPETWTETPLRGEDDEGDADDDGGGGDGGDRGTSAGGPDRL